MRNRFTELIEDGVASFSYTNIAPPIPEQDPICRQYNNIFSIASDTHMSKVKDGYVITGHMIAKRDWDRFLCSPAWGAVTFKTAGYECLCDFLSQHNLCGERSILNGDMVYVLSPGVECDSYECPCCYHTCESSIPRPIRELTTTGDEDHIKECFRGSDPAAVMNESSRVKGSQWYKNGGMIYGNFNNTVIMIQL